MSTNEEWNGVERRSNDAGRATNRVVVILSSGGTALVAVIALIFALVAFSDRLSFIQDSRQASSTDTCYLFRAVVIRAGDRGSEQFRNHAAAEEFLRELKLDNCNEFGRKVTTTAR